MLTLFLFGLAAGLFLGTVAFVVVAILIEIENMRRGK